MLRLRTTHCHGSSHPFTHWPAVDAAAAVAGASVHHQRVRLHRRGRIVQRVRVLRRLALQLALVAQRASATVAEEAANKRPHKHTIMSQPHFNI